MGLMERSSISSQYNLRSKMQTLARVSLVLLSVCASRSLSEEWHGPNGEVCFGEVTDGVLNGRVSCTDSEGAFWGMFKNSVADGLGRWESVEGEVCIGEFKNNVLHGPGKCTKPGEGVYEGMFENDMAHGYGEWTGEDGEVCTGEFKNDELSGPGKCTSPGEGVYEGNFEHNKPNGKGTWVGISGEKYVGDFVDDKAHGCGKYYNENGDLEFEGRFENDNPVENSTECD